MLYIKLISYTRDKLYIQSTFVSNPIALFSLICVSLADLSVFLLILITMCPGLFPIYTLSLE